MPGAAKVVNHSRVGIIPQTLRGGILAKFAPRVPLGIKSAPFMLVGILRRSRAVDEAVLTGYHPSPCQLPWTSRAHR